MPEETKQATENPVILAAWIAALILLAFVAMNVRSAYEGANGGAVESCYGWPLPAISIMRTYECKNKELWCCERCSGQVPIESLKEHPELWTMLNSDWDMLWLFAMADAAIALLSSTAAAGIVWTLANRTRRMAPE